MIKTELPTRLRNTTLSTIKILKLTDTPNKVQKHFSNKRKRSVTIADKTNETRQKQ